MIWKAIFSLGLLCADLGRGYQLLWGLVDVHAVNRLRCETTVDEYQ